MKAENQTQRARRFTPKMQPQPSELVLRLAGENADLREKLDQLLEVAEFFMRRLDQGIPPNMRKDRAMLEAAIEKAKS